MLEHVLQHGYAAVFLYVLCSQLGVPAPSGPLLIAVGAIAASGRIALAPAIATVVVACLLADSAWFSLGRSRGRDVIGLLCRLSLEPTSCIRLTEGAIHRHGTRYLLVAKFFPGVGLMAAPVAGESGTPYRRFLAFDAAGALLWASTYVILGRFFGALIAHNAWLLRLSVPFGLGALVVAILALVLARLVRRRRYWKQLATVGMRPAELKARMDRGDAMLVVDIRQFPATKRPPLSLHGAVNLLPDQVFADGIIPTDRDVVVICDCPGDAGSAQVATRLRESGLGRARHLVGGVNGWARAGYPFFEIAARASAA
jgi:membrane protein DedA with SNARE-associated domain/rhodanese-related sulfurtransferase